MEDNRIISPQKSSFDDGDSDKNLRPPSLAEFTGQSDIKESLSIAIEAARHRGDALDHCLFAGPPGLGKTTLAGIIAKEMEKILSRKGYTALFGSTEEDPERFGRLVQSFLEKDVEGFIIVPCVGCGPYIDRLQASGRPFVAIDRHHPQYDIPSVILDNVHAMHMAVGALKKQGARKMGLLTYAMRTSAMIEREKGFREDVGKDAPIYRMGFYTMEEDTRKAADAILEAGLDGMVCASNEASALLIKELIHRGIRVQEDIHIAGFDYSNVYDIFTPHIPHVEQPLPQMVKESTDYLFRLIDKKDHGEDISKEKQKIVLKANLI